MWTKMWTKSSTNASLSAAILIQMYTDLISVQNLPYMKKRFNIAQQPKADAEKTKRNSPYFVEHA